MRVKDIVRPLVPVTVRRRMRKWLEDRHVDILLREWDEATSSPSRSPDVRRPIERILVVPPDPATLMVSLGDDAMLTSVVAMARAHNESVVVDVLTASTEASRLATEHGMHPVEIWTSEHFVRAFADLLDRERYDAVLAMGADIMDGYHDFLGSAKRVTATDIAARKGIPASVLGFSFNLRPAPALAPIFDRADRRLVFRLRDRYSFERFRKFTAATATLVADSAFMLPPAEVDDDLRGWIDTMRAQGRRVIGVNIHPMLFWNATAEQVETIVQRCAEGIEACHPQGDLAWLLLPHDSRATVGDDICLEPLRRRLSDRLGPTLRHLGGRRRAAELKAIAGALDGVVAARMHLAIASLGMGTPVLGINYQDKFEGLFAHFDLPKSLLLGVDTYVEEGGFSRALIDFTGRLPELRDRIASRWDDVRSLSRENFSIFDACPAKPASNGTD